MRRYRTLGTLLLLALLSVLTACRQDSADDLATPAGGLQVAPPAAEGDSVYLALRIVDSRPPAALTRATEAEEKQINNGIVALFTGASEAEATLASATAIDQIASDGSLIVQRLKKNFNPASQHIYALVLLNLNGMFDTKGDGQLSTTLKKQNETEAYNPVIGTTKLSDMQQLVLTTVGSAATSEGFFMTNQPQSDGSVMPEVTTLFLTEAAAKATPVTIPVERAAAKLTVESSVSEDGATDIKVNGTPSAAKLHRLRWVVDNYNTQCFAIRHPDTSPSPLANWAEDINYEAQPDTHYTAADLTAYQQHAHEAGTSVYIAENTTSATYTTTRAYQTRVVVEAQLKDNSDMLWEMWYQLGDADGEGGVSAVDGLFAGDGALISYLKSTWWTTWCTAHGSDSSHDTYAVCSKTADEVFSDAQFSHTAGTVSVTLRAPSYFTTPEIAALQKLATTLSTALTGYREGRMYYETYIKHTGTAGLGQYGIVRNNAYTVTVSTLKALGSPTIPTATGSLP